MGTKRSADELDNAAPRSRRKDVKRTKLSSYAAKTSDSSAPSSRSISEDSALQSSPSASEHTRKTSLSSIRSSIVDNDSESSLGSSESVTESEWEDEEIVTIGGPKKPRMVHASVQTAHDLRSRLDALLPELAASNQLLAGNGTGMNMEEVQEGEEHIEMNLGLGVLEEKKSGGSSSTSESSDASDSDECTDEDVTAPSALVKRPREGHPPNVMEKLLGQSTARQKPNIEDIGRGRYERGHEGLRGAIEI